MTAITALSASLALALLVSHPALLAQEEPSPEVAGLQKAATDFVEAFNNHDAAAIAALFTEDGEMADITGRELTSGREQIKARYEEVFADNPPQVAVEVDSVRLVAPNLAIEDGTAHFTPGDDDEAPPRSVTYTAVLLKTADGRWRIASTRDLKDSTDAAGQLADLAEVLKGEWTGRTSDGVKTDLAFGWDKSGKFLIADMLTTTADTDPLEGTIRIGWNAARKSIVSWIFDGSGGSTMGIWTPTDDGWMIRSEGATADGEIFTANQKLTAEGKDILVWTGTNRVADGKPQPDGTMRFARQAPDPGEDEDSSSETPEETDSPDGEMPAE